MTSKQVILYLLTLSKDQELKTIIFMQSLPIEKKPDPNFFTNNNIVSNADRRQLASMLNLPRYFLLVALVHYRV